jgi:hypothetical protein
MTIATRTLPSLSARAESVSWDERLESGTA